MRSCTPVTLKILGRASVSICGLSDWTEALPTIVARDFGADGTYLPVSAMCKVADLYLWQVKTDARYAFIIADTTETMTHTTLG